MLVIDQTIVNVALPSIQRDLHASTSGLAWVVNGYVLTAGGLLLLGGRLSDLFGRRRLFQIGTLLFALASLVCGLAQNIEMLVASRFVQGAGEACASPAALALVAVLFADERERTQALGIWGGLGGLGATVGVLLSGIITNLISWRWVFLINLPIAAVALALVPRLITTDSPVAAGKRPDLLGALLITGSLTAVVSGLLAAARAPWSDPSVVWPLVGGVAALLAFVAVERSSREPLVPLRFFSSRTRVSANIGTVFLNSALTAMFFLLTLYMQNILGYSPLSAGLAYLPFCLAFVPGLIASTQITNRAGTKVTIITGFLVSAVGMLLASRIPVEGTYLVNLLPAMLVLAVGMGISLPALQTAALHAVSGDDAGLASGMQTTVQMLGGALGLAVFVTIALRYESGLLAAGAAPPAAATGSYQFAFQIATGVLVAGALLVLLMRQVQPQPAPGSGAA
jgi:EmrB/QacA subfamily drug resistance transporter